METQNTKLNGCCGEYKDSTEFIYCPVCGRTLQSGKVKDKDVLAAKDKELAEIKQELAKTQKRVKELETDKNNAVHQKDINQAREEGKAESNEKIQELQNNINELNEKLQAKENQQKEKETATRIDKLNTTIEEKTNEINRLTVDVKIRNDEIKRLKDQISGSVSIDDKEKQIKELNSNFVEKEAKYKVYIKIMLIAISVVSMLAIVSFVIMISSAPEDKPGGLMTVSFSNVIDNLEGSYTLSQTSNGQKIGRGISAVITEIATGEYKVETHDQENSPIPYYFSIGQHTLLNSPDMGVGDIKYTKNGKYNKISLEFRKGNTVWNYTKR